MEPVTVENVMKTPFENVRKYCFGSIPTHEDRVSLDAQLFVTRLGQYAALYQYFSEIYAFLIGQVRRFSEAKNVLGKMDAIDKRDCLELVLKSVKFQYDSMSRKVTIFESEAEELG